LKSYAFLETLLNTASPSGFEDEASQKWLSYLSFAKTTVDKYGNSIATIGSGTKVMLCGHIDEIGFMVRYISEEGFIYVSAIGGFDAHTLISHRVKIYNKKRAVSGVVGQKPTHLVDDEEEPSFDNVFIDIGAKDREDALKSIEIGDYGVIDVGVNKLLHNKITGRGLDDRVGAWVVAETLRRLYERNNYNVCISSVATVQEENGLYGATMLVDRIKPDYGVVIDLGFASDSPDVDEVSVGICKLGSGPILYSGSVSNKQLLASFENIGKANNISFQKQIQPRCSGTDADAIFIQRGGIPTINIGIPSRYMHSPIEIVDINDLNNIVELLVCWCESLK